MSKHKEENDCILREVFDEDYDEDYDKEPAEAADEYEEEDGETPPATDAPAEATKKKSIFAADDKIRCPRCRHLLADRHACPYCGYNGYIPMSEKQTRRIRLILFPIIFIIALVVFIVAKK